MEKLVEKQIIKWTHLLKSILLKKAFKGNLTKKELLTTFNELLNENENNNISTYKRL